MVLRGPESVRNSFDAVNDGAGKIVCWIDPRRKGKSLTRISIFKQFQYLTSTFSPANPFLLT